MGCRLAMRLYGVYMRCYGVYMAYYGGVYRGLCGHGLRCGLRVRRWDRRVWSVVCMVYVYGVYPLGYSVLWRGLSVGYGVHVWQV